MARSEAAAAAERGLQGGVDGGEEEEAGDTEGEEELFAVDAREQGTPAEVRDAVSSSNCCSSSICFCFGRRRPVKLGKV